MSKTNKVLIIIFFVLLVITLGEIGYYFFYQPVNKSASTTNQSPSPTPQTISSEKNQAINKDTLDNLLFLKKGIVKSSLLTTEYQGSIIEIDDKGGTNSAGQFEYKLKIKIKSDSGDTNSFYYNDSEINKIKVFYLDKDQKTPYFLNKLKVGDKILIKDIYNLLENIDNNLIEEEIIKL